MCYMHTQLLPPVSICAAQVNPQDSPELRLLRPKVLTAAGFLGHAAVMQQASLLLQQAVTGQAALAADVAQAVYSLAVGSGDEKAYETVQKMYEQVRRRGDAGCIVVVLYHVVLWHETGQSCVVWVCGS
jgi:hypothetical protein